MKKIWIFLFLILIVSGFSREMAGKVVAIQGASRVKYANRKDRPLVKGSPIFTEEKIIVGPDSKLQIKFTDDAILNLIERTEYIVQDYSFDSKRGRNSYSGEIFKGGFRHLTGKIAKENPEAVTIKGPNITIGIRGTLLQAIIRNGTMFVGCEFGEISVRSSQGSVVLGPNSRFQYSSVSDTDLSPKGLTVIPPTLQNQNFTPPPGGIPTMAPRPSAPTPEAGQKGDSINIKGGC